jgi:tripartite-type tricarboxylate transporter receptor subunit TctC
VLIAKPGLAATNFAELRNWISSNGGKVNLANAGLGSASHLCGLMLQSALKTNMTPVPYKGTAPAMTDLIAGQVDLMCEQATNAVPQIEGKKVKAYGVTGLQRLPLPALKDTPTLSEAGLKDFNVQVWHGIYAPRGTPFAVLEKLNAALRVALKDPELIKREEALGLTVVTDDRLSQAGHRKFVEAEKARWAKVIKDAGEYAD